MNLFLIYINLLADITTLVLGIVVTVKARDNIMKYRWGILTIIIAAFLLLVDIGKFSSAPLYPHQGPYLLLDLPGMLAWLFFATASVLVPLTSMRPGYITKLRLLLYAQPIFATLLIAFSYWLFNGQFTPLSSWEMIWEYAGNPDVELRLAIFAISIIVPVAYFFIPLFNDLPVLRRIAKPEMYIYLATMALLLGYYILHTAAVNTFIYYTFGLAVNIRFIYYSTLHLLIENPFSYRVPPGKMVIDKRSPDEVLLGDIVKYFEENKSFTNPEFSIDDLSKALDVRRPLILEAVKSGGWSGFREFLNYARVIHFKNAAMRHSGKNIKEMMMESGFNSRATFYRIFAAQEHMTPSDYIEKIRQK